MYLTSHGETSFVVSGFYERILVGVFYKVEKPTYEDTIPWIKEKALVEHSLENFFSCLS